MSVIQDFGKDPLKWFGDWQDTRVPWGIMMVTMVGLVLIAHYVFQDWLYMAPCEQCVYIRYGNLVMALGGLIALINPKSVILKICAYLVSLYGLIFTMICSWKLIRIHAAVHSDDPSAMFGIQGCSTDPSFPFSLPLAKWAPSWFKPTGDCGYDSPMPGADVQLSSLQQFFVDLYNESDGWYLIPQIKFMDMAQCCMLACIVCSFFLIAMIAGAFYKYFQQRKKESSVWVLQ